MANKGAGIIIYPEDIARIKRCVKPEYQFAVIWALSQYATDGTLPTEAELGEGGMVAFEFIVEKVRDALETYKANSEKRKAAANARWNAEESKPMQTDANGCKRMQKDAKGCKRMQSLCKAMHVYFLQMHTIQYNTIQVKSIQVIISPP